MVTSDIKKTEINKNLENNYGIGFRDKRSVKYLKTNINYTRYTPFYLMLAVATFMASHLLTKYRTKDIFGMMKGKLISYYIDY